MEVELATAREGRLASSEGRVRKSFEVRFSFWPRPQPQHIPHTMIVILFLKAAILTGIEKQS